MEARSVHVAPDGSPGGDPGRPRHSAVWFRITGPVPATPVFHAALVAMVSDLTVLSGALHPHGLSVHREGVRIASLDHNVWFHRSVRADRWMLFAMENPVAHEGRGLGTGHMFAAEGDLAATVVQEGLIERAAPAESPTSVSHG